MITKGLVGRAGCYGYIFAGLLAGEIHHTFLQEPYLNAYYIVSFVAAPPFPLFGFGSFRLKQDMLYVL